MSTSQRVGRFLIVKPTLLLPVIAMLLQIGSSQDQWLEKQNIFDGSWDRVGLLFGYGDDYTACTEIVATPVVVVVVAVTPIVAVVASATTAAVEAASATTGAAASATMPTGAAIDVTAPTANIAVAALTAGMPCHIVLTHMVAGAVGSIATL